MKMLTESKDVTEDDVALLAPDVRTVIELRGTNVHGKRQFQCLLFLVFRLLLR